MGGGGINIDSMISDHYVRKSEMKNEKKTENQILTDCCIVESKAFLSNGIIGKELNEHRLSTCVHRGVYVDTVMATVFADVTIITL